MSWVGRADNAKSYLSDINDTMRMKRIAVLCDPWIAGGPGDLSSLERARRLQLAAQRCDIDVRLFAYSEEVEKFEPDCVLSLSPQFSKLTRFPTYGVLDGTIQSFLEVPRFHRNVLTYDAYATRSHALRNVVIDMAFGVRKLDVAVAYFGCSLPMTPYARPRVTERRAVLRVTDTSFSSFASLIDLLVENKLVDLYGYAETDGEDSLDVRQSAKECDGHSYLSVYRRYGLGLCLDHGDEDDASLPDALLEIISSGAVAIVVRTPLIESAFGDTVLYVDPQLSVNEALGQIQQHIDWVQHHSEEAVRKSVQAHELFCEKFSLERLLPNLFELHEKMLATRGYLPSSSPSMEGDLPSVSYIVRTGNRNRGMLERMLDSLVSQRYPSLTVIFVLYSPSPYLRDVLARYEDRLRFRVVEDFGRSRSTGIITGMRAIETDLFGMIDDDDELHPNHVRSMVKALQYHDNRDWRGHIQFVYSGSIEVSDSEPRAERSEWHDHLYVNRSEKRAIEHFRFYNTRKMADHQWFLMSNAWLACRSLIDDEVLNDPQIDTCEDLYFFLQFAHRTHFAFSAEVTAVHHFHGTGNSTLVDAHRHLWDTYRTALRNIGRELPAGHFFLPALSPIGPQNWHLQRRRFGFEGLSIHASTQVPSRRSFALSRWRRLFHGTAGGQHEVRFSRLTKALEDYINSDASRRAHLRGRFWQIVRRQGGSHAFRTVADYGESWTVQRRTIAKRKVKATKRLVVLEATPMNSEGAARASAPILHLAGRFCQILREEGLRRAVTVVRDYLTRKHTRQQQ